MSENENLNESQPGTENQPGGPSGTSGEENKLSYEDLQAELKRVRQEAASRRIANRELEEKAKRWEEYEESQKTELQKLQEALAQKEKDLANYALEKEKRSLIKEFELEDDDLDLLTGADVEANRKIAEKLKAKNDKIKAQNAGSNRPADLLAGNRGTPVGSTSNDFNDTLASLFGRARG